ncbi:MAG TPA: class I SAM-dependent methyltransferase [Thermoanaerobaculia bacterium]|nr:class I SAM-dependent methyltransferase [Thermoanaerobaculia bacterium]
MDFDKYAATYTQEVERAVAFSGRGHDFFLVAKVRHILSLAQARCGDPSTLVGLDVGCGTGSMTGLLAPHCQRLYGIDIAVAGLREARDHVPGARFLRYDGRRLPFCDGAFDFAFAVCVLHHVAVAEWPAMVSEMARVVRSGGMVALFEHNPWNPLTRWVVARCPFDRDAVLLRCATLRRLLWQAGLENVEHSYILFFPWQRPLLQKAEAALGRLPLGAQYWVAASRP